jgi:hypothetical protein
MLCAPREQGKFSWHGRRGAAEFLRNKGVVIQSGAGYLVASLHISRESQARGWLRHKKLF